MDGLSSASRAAAAATSRAAAAAIALGLAAVACSNAAPDVGSTSSALASCGAVLATIDGEASYSNGRCQASGACSCKGDAGSASTGYGLGYQCVELAQRYYAHMFGFPNVWPVQTASQMCGAAAGFGAIAEVHYAGSGYAPVHGDLMVFAGGAGHVAIVDGASGSSIAVVEQNSSATGRSTRALGTESCFVHATANGGGVTAAAAPAVPPDPCAGLYDSQYCGDHRLGLTPGHLYDCRGGVLQPYDRACTDGCVPTTGADPDYCVEDASDGCSCDGVDQDGNAVHSDACGSSVCGYDRQIWFCGNAGYEPGGGGC